MFWTREKTRTRIRRRKTRRYQLGEEKEEEQRWMDCVNRDMKAIGTTKDKVHDRTGWRRIVSSGTTLQSRSG